MKISDNTTTRNAAAQKPGNSGSKSELPAFGASRFTQGANPQPKDTNRTSASANPDKSAKPAPANKPQSAPEKPAPKTAKPQSSKSL